MGVHSARIDDDLWNKAADLLKANGNTVTDLIDAMLRRVVDAGIAPPLSPKPRSARASQTPAKPPEPAPVQSPAPEAASPAQPFPGRRSFTPAEPVPVQPDEPCPHPDFPTCRHSWNGYQARPCGHQVCTRCEREAGKDAQDDEPYPGDGNWTSR